MYPPGSLRTYVIYESPALEMDFFYDPDELVEDETHPPPPSKRNPKHPQQQNHRKFSRK